MPEFETEIFQKENPDFVKNDNSYEIESRGPNEWNGMERYGIQSLRNQ